MGAQAPFEGNFAIVAKAGAAFACRPVQRDETCVQGPQNDSVMAGRFLVTVADPAVTVIVPSSTRFGAVPMDR